MVGGLARRAIDYCDPNFFDNSKEGGGSLMSGQVNRILLFGLGNKYIEGIFC